MSKLVRHETAFVPPPVQRAAPSAAGGQQTVAQSKRVKNLLSLVLVPHIVLALSYWLPETHAIPGSQVLLDQLAPIVSPLLSSDGVQMAFAQDGVRALLPAVLLLAALAAWVGAQTPWAVTRWAVIPAAGAAAVLSVLQILARLVRGQPGYGATGLLLLAVEAAVAVSVVRGATKGEVAQTSSKQSAGVLWLFGMSLVGPIALGRAVAGGSLRDGAAAIGVSDQLGAPALLCLATVYLWLAGMIVAGLVWGVYALAVSWRSGSKTFPVAMLIACLGPGLVLGLPAASSQADARVRQLRTEHPGELAGSSCVQWWTTSGTSASIVIDGQECRTVSTYRGYKRASVRTSSRRLGGFDTILTPERTEITSASPSASYGNVLVVPSAPASSEKATGVVGINFLTGREIWNYTCPRNAAIYLRFAGTGQEAPASGRKTLKKESAAVVVSCGKTTLRLKPATGK